MNSLIQKNIDKYNNWFAEVFKDLIDDSGNQNQPLIKSLNDCKSPNDFRLKLFIIRENIMSKLIFENDNIIFLKYILIKLNELVAYNEYANIWLEAIVELRTNIDKMTAQLMIDSEKLTTINKTFLKTSLRSELSPKQIEKLYELLIHKFIDPNDDFVKLFSDTLSKFEMPLKWKKSNKLLAYFLEALYLNELINAREYPSLVENFCIFLNNKGKPLTSNILRNAKSDNNNLGNPLGFAEIDRIIEAVKKV